MIIRKPITKPVMRSALTSLSTAASEAASALAVPPSLRSLLFHDDGTATEYPAYYTEEEWAEHSHLLKDYSLGVGDLREKRLGYCYDFDGVDDRIVTTFNPREILGSGPVSLACWVNLDDLGASTSQTSTFMGGFRGSSPDRRLYLRSESSGVVRLALGSGTVATTSVVLSANKWHHVVATFNGLNAKIYVDGTERTASGSGISADYFDYGLPIGDLFESSGTSYDGVGGENHETNGRISDVRIYNDALTADEVTYIYTNGQSGTDPGSDNLVAHYPLQEESGATAYDISGNGHHGTILNAVTSGAGSIHQPDAGVVKSYANDEGYSSRLLLGGGSDAECVDFGNVLNNVFAGVDKKFSIEATICLDDTASGVIVSKLGDGSQSANARQFILRVRNGRVEFGYYCIVVTATNYRFIEASQPILPRTRYHVKVLYDGEIDTGNGLDRVAIYINGVLQSTSLTLVFGTLGDIPSGTASLAVGAARANQISSYLLSGFVHDVKIWNNALASGDPLLEVLGHGAESSDWRDVTGGGVDGVIVGNAVATYIPGASATQDALSSTLTYTGRCPNYGLAKGPAWQGDGSSVYVDLGAPVIPATADWNASVWYFHAVNATKAIIGQYNLADPGRWQINSLATNNSAQFGHGETSAIITLANAFAIDSWHEIKFGRNGNQNYIQVYRNTELVASGTGSVSVPFDQSNALILARSTNPAWAIPTSGQVSNYSITTGGITTTYSPIEGTRNVAVTKSDGTYSIITDAVKNGALATLYSDGDGSWRLPAIENGAQFDGTGLYPAAPGASVAANGNALNIPANKHPIGVLVDRTGGVAAPFDYASDTANYTDEEFNTIPTENTLNKRGLSIYAADRYGASLEDIQS